MGLRQLDDIGRDPPRLGRMYAGHGSYSPRHIVPVAIRPSFHRANDALICRMHHKGLPIDNEVISQAEDDEKILSFNIPDEALERAASAEQAAFTWVYCTNGYYWYDCSWPQ